MTGITTASDGFMGDGCRGEPSRGSARSRPRRGCGPQCGRIVVAAVPFVLAVAAMGCSGERWPTAEVTGTVKLDGEPVEKVALEFEPVIEGVKEVPPTAYGMTDAEGRYRVTRVGGPKGGAPGAVVGTNIVRVSAPEGSTAKVHPHYAGDGALRFEVRPGPNVFDIELVKNPLAAKPRGK